MCTAITYTSGEHYFGRNLDLDCFRNETVVITPRQYPFAFRRAGTLSRHYAMIGMALAVDGYPLYYDATNEKGLSMAGLNFPVSAEYKAERDGYDNITPFEFIPWLLGRCGTLTEARQLLSRMNLLDVSFSPELPLAPLHWFIADQSGAIVVEAVKEGLQVYDNPVGVLTNEPPFGYQMLHLHHYMQLTCEEPRNSFAEGLELKPYCTGMGAMGLPGDPSSPSRFVRAAFTRLNSVSGSSEEESVGQFFHILDSVGETRGCTHTGEDRYGITVYTSCCNMDRGIYYYTTYENRQISAVDMYRENLDGAEIICYPLRNRQSIYLQN